MRTALMAIAVLAMTVGLAVAQPAAAADRMDMPMAGMPGMMKMPELTREQQSKMDAQRISHLREVGPIKTDIAVKEIELAGLWREENLDARKVMAKVAEISALKARLEAAMASDMIATHNLLTPEQRKAKHAGMGGMMHGKMPGMMMQGCPMMGGGMMAPND